MQMKWDIVENVVQEQRTAAVKRVIRKATGTLTTGLVMTMLTLPAMAARPLLPIHVSSQYVGQTRAGEEFRPPTALRRSERASLAEDTNVGMSTRRLAESYTHLFKPAEEEDVQMEYSFF